MPIKYLHTRKIATIHFFNIFSCNLFFLYKKINFWTNAESPNGSLGCTKCKYLSDYGVSSYESFRPSFVQPFNNIQQYCNSSFKSRCSPRPISHNHNCVPINNTNFWNAMFSIWLGSKQLHFRLISICAESGGPSSCWSEHLWKSAEIDSVGLKFHSR